MKNIFVSFLLILLPALSAWGQYVRSGEKPAWTEGFFQEEQNSYIEVVSAFGYDEESARNKAAEVAISRRNLATGAEMGVRVNGGNISVDGDGSLIVKSRIVDEYVEYLNGQGYRVYLLVQTAKNPTYDFEPVNVTDRYPFSMRAFVPGMAQIHKGNTGKGIAFISAEVVMLGGVVACECMRSYYDGKIGTTHNSDAIRAYVDNARLMSGLLIYKSTKTENYGICRLGLYGTIILGIGIIAITVVQNLVYFDMELYQKAVVIYNWGIVAAVCTVGWILLAVGTRTSLGMKIFLMARYPLFYLCTWLVGTHINYEDPISGNMVYISIITVIELLIFIILTVLIKQWRKSTALPLSPSPDNYTDTETHADMKAAGNDQSYQ